ncbi:MAG: plasmid stabilization protein [Rhizobiaceae bacterium]
MATLTIRNLDEETKTALRFRAARHGVSVEQEVRSILRLATLADLGAKLPSKRPGKDWLKSIRQLVEPHGGFDVDIPSRSKAVREPPKFE